MKPGMVRRIRIRHVIVRIYNWMAPIIAEPPEELVYVMAATTQRIGESYRRKEGELYKIKLMKTRCIRVLTTQHPRTGGGGRLKACHAILWAFELR